MKRKVGLLVLFCFLFLFSGACYPASDPDNLFELSSDSQSEIPEISETADYAKDDSESLEESSTKDSSLEDEDEEGYYQYGNMQKNVPSGNFIMYDGRVVFEALKSDRFILYEIDPDSFEVVPFKKDATENDYSEESTLDYFGGELEQYKGELYGLISGKMIGKWSQDHWTGIVNGSVNYFWHAKDTLFAVSSDGSLIKIKNGKASVVVDEYTAYWNVVYQNKLYGQSGDRLYVTDIMQNNPKVDTLLDGIEGAVIDGQYIYFCDSQYYLYRCEIDGTHSQQITDFGVLPASLNFDDNYLYFRKYDGDNLQGSEASSIYYFEKANPDNIALLSELFSSEEKWILNIFTVPGQSFIIVNVFEKGEGGANYYIVQIDGSGKKELLIP